MVSDGLFGKGEATDFNTCHLDIDRRYAFCRRLRRDVYMTPNVEGVPPKAAVSYDLTLMGHALIDTLKPLVFWARANSEASRSREADMTRKHRPNPPTQLNPAKKVF